MASVLPAPQRGRATPSRRKALEPAMAVVRDIGEMAKLGKSVVATAVRHPRGYWGDVRDECYNVLRICLAPAVLTTAVFAFLVAVFALSLLVPLGASFRGGGVLLQATLREFAPFLTGLIMAGVVGTALTADLGSRKIREELDAMRVLGLDPIRVLVLPRWLALVLMCAVFNMVSAVIGSLMCAVSIVAIGKASFGAFFASFLNQLAQIDIFGTQGKVLLCGILIATVSAHKGMSVGGGPEGVGRAVNHAVVISFLGVMVTDVLFNFVIQGLNPDMQVLR